jgi:hypothetical protein
MIESAINCRAMAKEEKTRQVNFRFNESLIARIDRCIEAFKAKHGVSLTQSQVVIGAVEEAVTRRERELGIKGK